MSDDPVVRLFLVFALAGCGRFDFAPYSPGGGDDGGNGDSHDGGTTSGLGRIAAGVSFTCMVRVDGSVWCWGLSDNRQLGNDSLISQSTPTRVATLPAIAKIAAGFNLACAIDRAGGVWCWGDNGFGALRPSATARYGLRRDTDAARRSRALQPAISRSGGADQGARVAAR